MVLELNVYNGFTGQEVKYTVRSGKERVLIVSVRVGVVGVGVSVCGGRRRRGERGGVGMTLAMPMLLKINK